MVPPLTPTSSGMVSTKRSALAATNSVFDPLGLVGTIAMQNKLFIQNLWGLSLGWNVNFEPNTKLTQNWYNS